MREWDDLPGDMPDDRSALLHARAEVICAATGKEVSEESYLRALHALDSEEARQTDADALEVHLRGTAAIADLATANLYAAGDRASASGYEMRYVREVERITAAHGLSHVFRGRV